jgi:large subunit ribosomal protein L27
MAHKKAGGSVAPNRDSAGKRRGLKLSGGQIAKPGQIIIRQCGTKFHPGAGVSMGRDFTIFAVREGEVAFRRRRGKSFVDVISGNG